MVDRIGSEHRCPDLERVCLRVREKSVSYDKYNFSSRYNDFLKAFFDLCQEYDTLSDFWRTCIAVPLEMTGFPCALYLLDEKVDGLRLVCDSTRGVLEKPEPVPEGISLESTAYEHENSYIVPIHSKSGTTNLSDDTDRESRLSLGDVYQKNRIFGMFEVQELAGLTPSDKFFFQKYCNRIGYNLHNKLISLQNIDHLKFINTLVMDIEHNIIVPNMYFKHIFNQLKKKIQELGELKSDFQRISEPGRNRVDQEECVGRCTAIYDEMLCYHQELVKHHANISLFLESLFRREHFRKGHLVLRTKRCFVEKEIILPQLENYASRLRAANVTIDRPRNMLEEEFEILVDVGLLSQVYANFFSNAAKYTAEIIDHHGNPRKAMAYGRELVQDFPKPGQQGMKFNVFTTGPQLSRHQAAELFEEGVRGEGSDSLPGTGHGLAFIKHVIELHGGRVGHEATQEGNNFYFILPVPAPAIPSE